MSGNAVDGAEPEAEVVRARMRVIWTRARPALLERLDAVDLAVTALAQGKLSDDVRAAAEHAAHRIAGTAGTFGFPRASQIATGLEDAFRDHEDDGHLQERAKSAALALRRELERSDTLPDEPD